MLREEGHEEGRRSRDCEVSQLELRIIELERIVTYSSERIQDFGKDYSRSLDLSILLAEADRIKAKAR